MSTVLVVDDESHAVRQVQICLSAEVYEVETAVDGREALAKLRLVSPKLVVLDLMRPAMVGLEVCRRIRQASDVPVIILSSRDESDVRIAGFEVGADDYLAKPFNSRELAARTRAILRRGRTAEPRVAPAHPPRVLTAGDLEVNLDGREVLVGGMPVRLARKEFDLLAALAEGLGVTLSREVLLSRVWGEEASSERRTVDVHVAWLRGKLRGSSAQVQSVWGVGYRLIVNATGELGPANGSARVRTLG